MFTPDSRYAGIEKAVMTLPDGREVSYVRRRFCPPGRSLPLLATVRVKQHERLDVFTHRTLGDPEQFWRIADANDAMAPNDILTGSFVILRVPLPQP